VGFRLPHRFSELHVASGDAAGDPEVTETLGKLHLVLGRTFFDGQLAVAGARAV